MHRLGLTVHSVLCFMSAFVCSFSICAVSHQLIQSEAQAAVLVQDKEAPLPSLTMKDGKVKSPQDHTNATLMCFFKKVTYPRPLHRVVKICPLWSQTQPACIGGFGLEGHRTVMSYISQCFELCGFDACCYCCGI